MALQLLVFPGHNEEVLPKTNFHFNFAPFLRNLIDELKVK